MLKKSLRSGGKPNPNPNPNPNLLQFTSIQLTSFGPDGNGIRRFKKKNEKEQEKRSEEAKKKERRTKIRMKERKMEIRKSREKVFESQMDDRKIRFLMSVNESGKSFNWKETLRV